MGGWSSFLLFFVGILSVWGSLERAEPHLYNNIVYNVPLFYFIFCFFVFHFVNPKKSSRRRCITVHIISPPTNITFYINSRRSFSFFFVKYPHRRLVFATRHVYIEISQDFRCRAHKRNVINEEIYLFFQQLLYYPFFVFYFILF